MIPNQEGNRLTPSAVAFNDKGENVETLKAAIHQLEQASHALSRSLYTTADAQGGAGDDATLGPNGRSSGTAPDGRGEDAIDAEFVVQ